MAENVEDLTVAYTEGDLETVKELDKKILTKGAWATVIFKFQSWDNGKNAYTPVKYTIRRYQKRNGVYQAKSKFNISSNDQAQKIIGALTEWLSEEDSKSD
ncbi:MAG TPA: hypothetical protein DCL40_05660 [Coxiellaceae bacterium]|nr:hypothetical protein [Coxiellaceae bacterium]